MDRHAPTGQRCSVPACDEPGQPDPEIPCAAFCEEHTMLPRADRVAAFQAAVEAAPESVPLCQGHEE